jgi:hypothetical protein
MRIKPESILRSYITVVVIIFLVYILTLLFSLSTLSTTSPGYSAGLEKTPSYFGVYILLMIVMTGVTRFTPVLRMTFFAQYFPFEDMPLIIVVTRGSENRAHRDAFLILINIWKGA